MHDFGVSLRLGMMVFMVSRVKQSILKCFWKYGTRFVKSWVMVGELDLES